jgi:hypothetical protein
MKTLFQLAAGLCYITAAIHLYLAATTPSDPRFASILGFGLFYLILGVLLTLKKRFAIWLGLIVPMIPLALSPFMADFKDKWTIMALSIDLAIVLCSLLMIANKRKN